MSLWPPCPNCKSVSPDSNCHCDHSYHNGYRCASCDPATRGTGTGTGTGHPLCVGPSGTGCPFWKQLVDELIPPPNTVVHGMGCSKDICVHHQSK